MDATICAKTWLVNNRKTFFFLGHEMKDYYNDKAELITDVLKRIERVSINEKGEVFLYLKDSCVDDKPCPITDFVDSSFSHHLIKLIESWKF